MANDSNLTLKQKRFADEYIITANATQAAIKAGYSKKYANTNATKLLQNTTIKRYLDKRLKEIESEKTASIKEVMEYLTSVMRGEQTEQVLKSAGDYQQEITDIDVSAKDRLKAADLLNKIHQAREDKGNTAPEPIIIVDRWDDDE
nr:MAG TPA: Terminase small subunit [Caudoviricetes sp.]